MCGKGSATTTQTQSSSPNPQAATAYSNVLNQAQGVAATPYQPYTGELTAPVNAQQYSGISNINNYQPAYGTALGMAYQGAQPITAAQIQQYESPYTQNVVNTTEAQFNNQNAQQQQQVLGNAAAQGALGGNRVGIAQAELANQQNLAQAPVIANLENQGYTTGLNTALTEQQALEQGAYGVEGAANAGVQGGGAQMTAGGLEQQTQQAADTANYQQYLNALGYPFQTTQWLAGLDTGVGSQMGGTSYGTTTAPPPSMLGQIMGGVGSGVGALGATGAFGSSGWLAALGLSRGGVAGYAEGGGVAGPEHPTTIPEDAETLHAQQRQLVAGDRHVQMFPHGSRELPVPHGMQRVVSHSGVFHYNPKQIYPADIHYHSRNGNEHALLGLGPHSKHEIMHRIASGEHPVAVVERNEHGHEVRAALGTHVTAPVQYQHMLHGKSKNHTLHIEHPSKVINDRLRSAVHRQSGGSVSNYQVSAMPYSGGTSYIPSTQITHGSGPPQLHMQAPPSSGQPQQMPKFQNPAEGLAKRNKADASGSTGTPGAGLDPSSADSDNTYGQQDWDPDVDPTSAPGLDPEDIDFSARGGAVGVAHFDTGGGDTTPYNGSLYDVASLEPSDVPTGVAAPTPTAPDDTDTSGYASLAKGADNSSDLSPPAYNPSKDTGVAGGAPMVTKSPDPSIPTATVESVPLPRERPADADVTAPLDESAGLVTSTAPTADGVAVPPIQGPVPLPRSRPDNTAPAADVAPPMSTSPVPDSLLDKAAVAAKTLESSGRYGNVTTSYNKQGQVQHALGAYGIMDFNLPQWSREALGHEVSQEEFLKDPTIQDKIFRSKMGDYLRRFGPEGAGRAWLGGEGALNAPLRKDPLGTSVGDYGRRFAEMVGAVPPGVGPSLQKQLPAKSELTQASGVAVPSDAKSAASGVDWGSSNPLWGAMIAGGANMLASRSPFWGVALGEGLQAGQGEYQQQKELAAEHALNQQKVSQAADRLSQEADWHQKQYDLQSQQHAETTRYHRAEEQFRESQPKNISVRNETRSVFPNPDGTYTDAITHEIYGTPRNGQPSTPAAPPTPGAQPPVTAPVNPNAPSASTSPATPASVGQVEASAQDPAASAAIKPGTPLDEAALPINSMLVQDSSVNSAMNPPGTRPEVLQKMQQDGYTPGEIETVRAVGTGRQAFLPTGRPGSRNYQLMTMAHEYNPELDQTWYPRRAATAKNFAVGTQGGGGQNITAMNTWAQHMNEYLRLEKQADFGPWTDFNDFKIAAARHGLGTTQAQGLYRNLLIAQKAVADEGAKVFAGSNSTLEDRKAWLDRLAINVPFAVALDNAKEVSHLVAGRLSSVANQYNEGMRTSHNPQEFVAPQTRAVMNSILGADDPTKFTPLNAYQLKKADGSAEPSAEQGQRTLNEDDQKAVAWARANPSNPKAAEILKLHGMQ